MNKTQLALTFSILFGLQSIPLQAYSTEEAKKKSSAEEVYAAFDLIPPYAIWYRANKAARLLEKLKGEIPKEFHQSPNRWWHGHVMNSATIIQDCSKMHTVANPVLPQHVGKKILHSFKDVNGKLPFLEACNQVKSHPDGAWIEQTTYWPDTEGPLRMMILIIQVRGTPYQVTAFYPTLNYSQEELTEQVSVWKQRRL